MATTPAPAASASTGRKSPASRPASFSSKGSKGRVLAAAALSVLAVTAAGAAVMSGGSGRAQAAVVTNCAASPGKCGYPDAASTGVPAGTVLKLVPSQVSHGPGWTYSASAHKVTVTGTGAVLSGLSIAGDLEIDASNVTVKDVKVTTGGNYGIDIRHTTKVTVQDSTISGLNTTTGRVNYAVDDVYGDSTGMVISGNNISDFRTAVAMSNGTASGNYIHNPGYIAGDHTNGFYANGGTQGHPLTIQGNTILNSMGQTDAINLDAGSPGMPTGNMTVEGNLLAGGAYTIYGGSVLGNATSHIIIQGNRFAQTYYPTSGQYGPVTYFDPNGAGSNWSGNVWDTSGNSVPSA
jgi:Right handed beta helix region